MNNRGLLWINPDVLEAGDGGAELEVVVPYSEPYLTAAVLRKLETLCAGLNARISLIAVHSLPYPQPFVCPPLVHAHLVEQLTELASSCCMAVTPQVVLARDHDAGLKFLLKPGSTVMIGTRKHLFASREEKLAKTLAEDGHRVVLLHIE